MSPWNILFVVVYAAITGLSELISYALSTIEVPSKLSKRHFVLTLVWPIYFTAMIFYALGSAYSEMRKQSA